MKAVMANVPEHILEWRRRTGADQWDEMWDGVLHMVPSRNRDHQDFEYELEALLREYSAKPNGCRVYHQINISEPGTWPNNYRIPDLVLLTPERFHIDCNEYFDGGPDAVVEIHSPGDEAYEKLPFYAAIGVREVLVIDRDTRELEVYELVDGEYHIRKSGPDGWIKSTVTDIELRAATGDKLEIRILGRDDTQGAIAMKMIFAVIQPTKLDAVQQALARLDVTRMTVGDAMGYARQRGQLETYRGHEYKTNLLRKIALEIAVNDDFVDRTVECLEEVARTSAEGHIGDGKIFVVPMEQAIQISDGYRGKGAI